MRTSVPWYVFDASKFKVSLSTSSLHTSENVKRLVDISLNTSSMVSMLGLFRYFKMIFTNGLEIFLELELLSVYSVILRFVTMLEKK